MNLEPGKTYVRRLSAVSRERDALALRLRLERALAGADFHPPGLPASAILCVRRLSDSGARPTHARGALAFAEWQRSVAAAIERLARHASMPARGPVPANAEAVIFNDRAELLACLAADWCEEAAPARWWWRSLFGGLDVAAALLSVWLGAPEHVPAALNRLSVSGKLIPFAHALGENEARSIQRRVVEKFGLREVAAALDSAVVSATRAASPDAAARPRPGAAPWRREVPELRGYGLGLEQSCMVGVGLLLLRAPARVRSSPFAESIRRWRLGSAAPASEKPEQARPEVKVSARPEAGAEAPPAVFSFGHEATVRREGITYKGESDDGTFLSRQAPDDEEPRVEHEGVVDEASFGVETFVAEEAVSGEGEEPAGLRTVEVGMETRPVLQTRGEEGETEPESYSWKTNEGESVEVFEFAPPPPVVQARIQTRFGGLFYLVNLGLALNLYGDFTTPLRPGIALPLWDFLALLGDRLCGGRVREDAVWGLLAGLSGRHEEEAPGRDFEPDEVWRLPAEWLAPFPSPCVLSWSDARGRLRVRHAEGFLVIDVPHGAASDTERRLAEELRVYGGLAEFALRRAPSVFDEDEAEGGALERWLGRLLPYVNARLRRALGVGEPGAAARLVCEHEARLCVTETRLDVTFALERLPVEVRLSGLDRDPGWVPAAGRYVAFNYE